jgi:(1->4)-alpha-D-glucan 1-alpha-D-glucosylmutase
LSECADEWAQGLRTWSRILRAASAGESQQLPPDRNEEYFFYQHLLGAWPPNLSIENPDIDAFAAFRKRVEAAMMKTIREAKVHSTWALPNSAYEEAVFNFIGNALDVSRRNYFLEAFSPFLNKVAAAGMRNSLVQTVLKLTLPGVPDVYQGAELWDFNFVDPDNRRPVDYAIRRRHLEELSKPLDVRSDDTLRNLADDWSDGRVKLRSLFQLLQFRRKWREVFQSGSYEALTVSGAGSDRICAFIRREHSKTIIVAVLRYQLRSEIPNATIDLPAAVSSRQWTSLFSGREVESSKGALSALDLFRILPVAVLSAT